MSQYPSRSEFLSGDISEVRAVAPATLILAAGGTRRRAALDGVSPNSPEYVQQARQQMLNAIEMILDHGVRHVFVPILADGNYQEQTPGYREKLFGWMTHSLADPGTLALYAEREWQVRLVGAELIPELGELAETLHRETRAQRERCVWYTVAPSSDAAWDLVFQAAHRHGARTRAEAIRALYGQEIPADDVVLLDFGKPQVFTSAVPPLLISKLHCYWRQSLGYALTTEQLRAVIHDFAFLRRTWMDDKTGRAEEALRYRTVWDDPPILGLGTRLGPFWYPDVASVAQVQPEPTAS